MTQVFFFFFFLNYYSRSTSKWKNKENQDKTNRYKNLIAQFCKTHIDEPTIKILIK